MFKLFRNDYSVKFSNATMTMVKMLDPSNLIFVGGRGVSKTTELIAFRIICMAHCMPRFSIGYMADTFVNLQTNLIPTLIMGLERLGYFEGKDFVVGKEPPKHWGKPILRTGRYKNCISFWNGFKIYLISADRPSLSAGLSLAHIVCEEAKFIKRNSFNRMMPTLRENPQHAPKGVHYFQGMTIVTDMPNVHKKSEYDWVLSFLTDRKEFGLKDLITTEAHNRMTLETAFTVNDIAVKLAKSGMPAEDIAKDNNYLRWKSKLDYVRMDSSAFFRVSSYANADILRLRFFENLWNALDMEDFFSSVLSINARHGDGEKFFPKFDDKNIFSDGYLYRHYDKFGISSETKETAAGLRYYRPNLPIYAGMDFGNMNSLVCTQEQGNVNRALKEFAVIRPNGWFAELALQFTEFFASAKNKNLHLYYDRAGNNFDDHGYAKLFKNEIEKLGKGWIVHLESIGKSTVFQADTYNLFQVVFDPDSELLLVLDEYNCRNLISSIELAETKRGSDGRPRLDKSSEGLKDPTRLLNESTNLATAYIYLIEGRYSHYMPTIETYSWEAMS